MQLHAKKSEPNADKSIARRQTQILKDLNSTLKLHANRMKLNMRDVYHEADAVQLNTHLKIVDDKIEILSRLPIADGGAAPSVLRPSPARQRRSERELIKNYRVNYTWNRGGRLKEIRIRTLARKYYCVWKRRVFGRVLPSSASAHYGRVLMRKVFMVFFDEWYKNRREWKLIVRAACHDRFRLWNKYWKMWKLFVRLRRDEKSKEILAIEYRKKNLYKWVIFAWKSTTAIELQKSVLGKKAGAFYVAILHRTTFMCWKSRLSYKQRLASLECCAEEFHGNSVLLKYFKLWHQKFSLRQEIKVNIHKADEHRKKHQMRVAWKAIKEFVAKQRYKHSKYAIATRLYTQSLLKRWQCVLQKKAELEALEDVISSLAEKSTRRRMFIHWKHYMSLNHERKYLMAVADGFYYYVLMRKAVTALSSVVEKRKVKDLHNEQANMLFLTNLMNKTWCRWVRFFEQKEELKILHQSHKAYGHYRKKLLLLVFEHLKSYVTVRCIEHAKEYKADNHWTAYLLSKSFGLWRYNTELQSWKGYATNQAESMYRSQTEYKCFTIWCNTFQKKTEFKQLESEAEKYHSYCLAKKVLDRWLNKTQALQDDYENMFVASEHHRYSVLHSAFSAWKLLIHHSRRLGSLNEEAYEHRRMSLLKNVWCVWKQVVSSSLHKKNKVSTAEVYYNRKLLKSVFKKWLNFHQMESCSKYKAEGKYEAKCFLLMRKYFQRWQTCARYSSSQRKKVESLRRASTEKLCEKVIDAWRKYTLRKLEQRADADCKIQTLRQKYDMAYVSVCFTKWRSDRDAALLMRLKMDQAEIHCQRKALGAAWRNWKDYTKNKKRTEVLMRLSEFACEHATQKKYYVLWRERFHEWNSLKRRIRMGLFHWGLCLQRKCLIAWFGYAERRKQKKLLYQHAFEEYKQKLVKEGLVQWFRYADHMSQLRERIASDRHIQSLHWSMKAVQKCFYHWKSMIKRKDNSKTQLNPLQAFTQSFISPTKDISVNMSASPLEVISPCRSRPPYKPFEQIVNGVVLNSCISQTKSSKNPTKRRELPKRPSFLMESLEKEGLWKIYADELRKDSTESLGDEAVAIQISHGEAKCPPLAVKESGFSLYEKPLSSEDQSTHEDSLYKPADFCGVRANLTTRFMSSADESNEGEANPNKLFTTSILLPPSAFEILQPTQSYQNSKSVSELEGNTDVAEERDTSMVLYIAEIEEIKEKLSYYKMSKKRYKKLNQQKATLLKCMSDLDGGELAAVSEEITALNTELNDMREDLPLQKTECNLLSERLHQLIYQLAQLNM